MTDEEFEEYFAFISLLSRRGAFYITRQLNIPKNKRDIGYKENGTSITNADIDFSVEALKLVRDKYPHISCNFEEIQWLVLNSILIIWIDPVDPTNDVVNWDPTDPTMYFHASSMISMTYNRRPIMFALATPLLNTDYSGYCWKDKRELFLNDEPFTPPELDVPDDFIIGLNNDSYPDYLEGLHARHGMNVASVAARLAVLRAGIGGSVHVDRPYETNCIVAAAEAAGAEKVTDEYGNPYLSGQEGMMKTSRVVWSYDIADHERIMEATGEFIKTHPKG